MLPSVQHAQRKPLDEKNAQSYFLFTGIAWRKTGKALTG